MKDRQCGSSASCGGCSASGSGVCANSRMTLFEEEAPAVLTEEQARFKREIYERMNPRRRKFIDKIGYDIWDPFQEPKEPLDIRKDRTRRTLQELLRDFMKENDSADRDPAWRQGALDCALGIIKKDERYQGIFDFCLWYNSILDKEGHRRENS